MVSAIFWWIPAERCDPPHRVTHEEKLEGLIASMRNGWNGPVLLGYPLDGRYQLITGSHRHAAARVLNIRMPVVVIPYSYVESIWGTEKWVALLSSVPYASEGC